jgi:hypothetical protein
MNNFHMGWLGCPCCRANAEFTPEERLHAVAQLLARGVRRALAGRLAKSGELPQPLVNTEKTALPRVRSGALMS